MAKIREEMETVIVLPDPEREREGAMTIKSAELTRKQLEDAGSVVHPRHYNSHPSGVECITVIQHFTFNVGTAIKHLWRSGLKKTAETEFSETQAALQDVKKSIEYLKFEEQRLLGLLG